MIFLFYVIKKEEEEIRIVFLGGIGIGKSVIVNIIFGSNCFRVLILGLFLIKICLLILFNCFDCNFVIVDIFGIFDLLIINEFI